MIKVLCDLCGKDLTNDVRFYIQVKQENTCIAEFEVCGRCKDKILKFITREKSEGKE